MGTASVDKEQASADKGKIRRQEMRPSEAKGRQIARTIESKPELCENLRKREYSISQLHQISWEESDFLEYKNVAPYGQQQTCNMRAMNVIIDFKTVPSTMESEGWMILDP